jgi:radical SAM superfamily enzyme YgiQ (UPF0313 family)
LARYVLISDTTLSHEYRNFPLLDFLASAPSKVLPKSIYSFLKGPPPPSDGGRARVSTYSLRKLEASLRRRYSESEVVVAHEDHIEDFIDNDTEVVGISTMDPLGLGPLTMSFSVFFRTPAPAYVNIEFESLVRRVNRARAGKKAKLMIGGPGVWELTVRPEAVDHLDIDYAFQGEADDIAPELFEYVSDDGSERTRFFRGFQTFDSSFHKQWVGDDRFISRFQFSRQFPSLEDIPDIAGQTVKGMVEVMRGCGIGCDFCEVTLRPFRYYPPARVRREIEINVRGGQHQAWLHSDEIFAYEHGRNFVPNAEAILDLAETVMSTPGLRRANATHGRISIPAAYPELIKRLSRILRTGPDNWIGLQIGVETGSERLAKMHMPNKTLPLRIGPDGSWQEIVWKGTFQLNRYYWRPAFTVQVGQEGETPEDNWDTVALVNRMSRSEVDGRPFEFTITPMQNVPLGHIRSKKWTSMRLDESQLAVYYACYRHLARMTSRNALRAFQGGRPLSDLVTNAVMAAGGRTMLEIVSIVCKRGGLNLEKAARHGVEEFGSSRLLSNLQEPSMTVAAS